MEGALVVLSYALAAWTLAGAFLGLLGGFNFIRRIEISNGYVAKTWVYWATLLVLYPIIVGGDEGRRSLVVLPAAFATSPRL